ncbi:MAG TPA: matrixin family metalloprotease [Nitrospira sp.]|nr:matrixin family metalloprotease [Nitrospira sp.]
MPKKPSPSSAPKKGDEPVKICFERIIPDELDPERAVRRALREHMATSMGRKLNADEQAHVARMALISSKKWQPGTKLRCRFLDGSTKMKKKVRAVAHQWEKYCDIKLKFVTTGPAEVRISFYADAGSWSAVGRDALNQQYFPLHQPTMNFGWLRDDTDDTEYSRVVLHEFGHALGCIHEHQSPKFTRVWNTKAVMKYFSGPPNYWSADQIKHNVLQKYSPKGIAATSFDPKSIMLYAFDGALFSDGLGPTNENTNVSQSDIKMIKAMYP